MNEKKCLNCGKSLEMTPGKREKTFCNATCRSNFWQKEQRKKPKEIELSGATQYYAKTSGLLPASYEDYSAALDKAKTIEECEQIHEKAGQNDSLSRFQKETIKKMAIQKSQKLDS